MNRVQPEYSVCPNGIVAATLSAIGAYCSGANRYLLSSNDRIGNPRQYERRMEVAVKQRLRCAPRGMKIEIILTTREADTIVEKVVAHGRVTKGTNIKDFLTWYAARLFKGSFHLYRDEGNVFGWAAIDSRGDTLTIR